MSPTVLRIEGFRVVIYLNDHDPAHVHVKKDGHEARIQLDPVQLIDQHGYKPKEIKRAIELVGDNQSILIATWENFHPSDEEERTDENDAE